MQDERMEGAAVAAPRTGGKRVQPKEPRTQGGGSGKKAGAGRILLRTSAVLLTFVAALALTLLISLKMICSSAFPSAQQMFVTTILETGQLKFLASWFLSSEEIQEIVDKNSMKALNASVDAALIRELEALDKLGGKALAQQRYQMFRAMGQNLPPAGEEVL